MIGFWFASIETPLLKRYKFFALSMLVAILIYTAELFDNQMSTFLTRSLLPMLYFSIGMILVKAFNIIKRIELFINILLIGNALLLFLEVLFLIINTNSFVFVRIINSLSLFSLFCSLVTIEIYSIKNIRLDYSFLIILRAILLLPYIVMIGYVLIDQYGLIWGNRLISNYEILFSINIIVLVSIGICFTLEGSSELMMRFKTDSETDELTKISNRRHLENSAKSFLKNFSSNTIVSVALLDIDFFKKINDSFGHDVGDLVLKEITQLISSEIRGNDLFGRIGGEEFCILINTENSELSISFFERIRKKISEEIIKTEDESISITVSIGIAHKSFDNENYSTLIKRADRALYEAKRKGRNRCIVG